MSLLTPAVLLILLVAAVAAAVAYPVRSRNLRGTLLIFALLACALGSWLGASDAWAFRDGFGFGPPRFTYPESHGLHAAWLFLRGSWVPLLGLAATLSLIVASWRHRSRPTADAPPAR
jgi:hypothetical protein